MPFRLSEKTIQIIREKSPNVTALNLGQGGLLLDDAVEQLVDLLNENYFITELDLSERCVGDEAGKTLAKLKYIKKLNLFRNNISKESVGELVSNDCIEELNISQNNLDNDAAEIIVKKSRQLKLNAFRNEGISKEMYNEINKKIAFNNRTRLSSTFVKDIKENSHCLTIATSSLEDSDSIFDKTIHVLPENFYTHQLLKINEEKILLHGTTSPRNEFFIFHTKIYTHTTHQYGDFKETIVNQFHAREIKQIDDFYIDDNDQNRVILLNTDFKMLVIQTKILFNFKSIQSLNSSYFIIFKNSGSIHVFPKSSFRQMMEADEKFQPTYPVLENEGNIRQMIIPKNNCVILLNENSFSQVGIYTFDEKHPDSKLMLTAEVSSAFDKKIYILKIDDDRILICQHFEVSNASQIDGDKSRIDLAIIDMNTYSIISHFYFFINNENVWRCEYGVTRQDQTIFLMFSTSYKRPKHIIVAIDNIDKNGFYYVLTRTSVLPHCSLIASNQIVYINENQQFIIQDAPAPSNLRKEPIFNALKLVLSLQYLNELLPLIAEYATYSQPLSTKAASFFHIKRTQEFPINQTQQTTTYNCCNIS